MANLELVSLIVHGYDAAIDFFVRVLQFDLIEDEPSTTHDGRPKRWVVVRARGGVTGVLLAKAAAHGVGAPTTDFIIWLVERPVADWP